MNTLHNDLLAALGQRDTTIEPAAIAALTAYLPTAQPIAEHGGPRRVGRHGRKHQGRGRGGPLR